MAGRAPGRRHRGSSRLAALASALMLLGGGDARAQPAGVTGDEPVIGGPCEGCEAVFEGLPDALSSRARIAPPGEPGEPMRIEGTVTDQEGNPAAGIVVYAYHTDAHGIYPPPETPIAPAADRHGRLRGWAVTDAAGRYRFDTIRPASYPDTDIPAHVHMHVIEPGRCTYWINSIQFEDDPRLTDEDREAHAEARGGNALADPARDEDGTWVVRRDIVLGLRVPGYAEVGPPGR